MSTIPVTSDVRQRLQRWSSRTVFALLRAQTVVYDRTGLPVISTARPFRFYCDVFFDGADGDQVLASLQGKRILDIGCGFTPFLADSMFQACYRRGIEFYGVDPKLKDTPEFNLLDGLARLSTNWRTPVNPNAVGADRRIAALADDLPFADHSIDLVLSSWLLNVWIHDPPVLAAIYHELARVLRPGGRAMLFPQPEIDPSTVSSPWSETFTPFQLEQRFLRPRMLHNIPPSYLTILTRR